MPRRHVANSLLLAALEVAAVVVTAATAAATSSNVVFGTVNGYDVGGTDALCFVSSQVRNSTVEGSGRSSTNNSSYISIESLDSDLYNDGSYRNDVRLLPQCFEGTRLDLVLPTLPHPALDLVDDRTSNRLLYIGQPYAFQLTLQTNVTAIDSSIRIRDLRGKSTIHARLQLCDAIRVGFCNPLVDTRDALQSLQPQDTDLNASSTDVFALDENKWKYKEGSTLLGIVPSTNEDGPLVFSRWIKWTLKEVVADSEVYQTTVNITLQLPPGIRTGAYFVVGHAVMVFDLNRTTTSTTTSTASIVGNTNSTMQRMRIDVANAVPNNVVEVREPPRIQTVSRRMKVAMGVTIGVVAFVALSMFFIVVYYRNHPVMLLAQGSFLAAMTGACVFEIVATFLFLPTRDIHCSLSGPLVLVPLTFIAACMVGRICRAYRTLAVAQRFARRSSTVPATTSAASSPEAKASFDWEDRFISALFSLANLPFGRCANHNRSARSSYHRRKSLRQTATASETISLITLLTLPQLVVQMVVAVLVDRKLEVRLDPFGTVGHVICSERGRWVSTFGTVYTAFVCMIAVAAAWVSRSLPSAFNESEQVFHAASISTVLAFVSQSLLQTAYNPTTHPDVLVFLRSMSSIGITCCVLVLIVLPKIRRAWSGEKVVISALFGSPSTFGTSSLQSSGASSGTPPRSHVSGGSVPERAAAIHSVGMQQSSTVFKVDEPLPSAVEQHILGAQIMLRQATERFIGGRQLSTDEFATLQKEITSLKDELDLVEMDTEVLDDC